MGVVVVVVVVVKEEVGMTGRGCSVHGPDTGRIRRVHFVHLVSRIGGVGWWRLV